MKQCTKEMTREEWETNTEVTKSGVRVIKDEMKFFGEALCCGYGIYGTRCYEKDGKYLVNYSRGETCD